MNKRRFFDHWLDIVFFIFIIVSTISAVSYLSSEQVFDAQIVYVNNVKLPYNIILNIEPKVKSELEYNVEVIYKKEKMIVASKNIVCDENCEVKLDFNKIFFDNYDVVIQTKYKGQNYQKKLKFNLEKVNSNYNVELNEFYEYNINQSSVNIFGKVFVSKPSQIFFEVFPKNDDSNRFYSNMTCLDECDFNFNLTSSIVFGKYNFNVYFEDDVLAKSFEITSDKNLFENKTSNDLINNNLDINLNDIYQILKNNSLTITLDKKKQEFSLSNLFYNNYINVHGLDSNFDSGSKVNSYAFFNYSNYFVYDIKNIEISIEEGNFIVIDKNTQNFDEKYVIFANKKYQNLNFTNLNQVEDFDLNDFVLVFFVSSYDEKNELESSALKNKIITKDNKQYYKTNLQKKFSDESFSFELETKGLNLEEINKQDINLVDKIDYLSSKNKNLRVAQEIKKTKDKINGNLKHSEYELEFKGLELDEAGIDLDVKKFNKRFEFKSEENKTVILNDIFAIDPSRLEFDYSELRKVAKGNSLYKCREWDYNNEICLGSWEKIMNLIPGVEYSVEIYPADPAFSEAGIIFQDNFEPGGAYWLGYWQNIVETDSELTTSWGMDSQFKYGGSYSLTESPGKAYEPSVSSGGYQPHTSVVTPPINLSGLVSANATFYHRIYLEADTGTSCWDAILTKISTDGVIWNYVLINGYTERTISTNSQPEEVTGDGFAICGQYTTWSQVSIDLTPYVGNQTVYIKWSFTADDNTGFDGYNIDNFVVYGRENQNPVIASTPGFNPDDILVGEDSIFNVSITDDSPLSVIGTFSFANTTISNYTLNPLVLNKNFILDIEDSIVSQTGANVTVFTDAFANMRYWTRDIGTANDWDINAGRLHVDQVSPFPQYVTLNPPIDMRDFSQGKIVFTYSEVGIFEANDCLYYSVKNETTSWSSNSIIFCHDLAAAVNADIALTSGDFAKEYQFRFEASRVDQAAEDVFIDNFFIYAWHRDSKTLGKLYYLSDLEDYTQIDYINVTIVVDSYSPVASVANGNNKPDLYIALSDGSGNDALTYVGKFNLTSKYLGNVLNSTDATFTYIVNTNSILNYWKNNPSKRYLRIGAINLDYRNAGSLDDIKFKDVKVNIKGKGAIKNLYGYNFSNFVTAGVHNFTDIYITDYFGQKVYQSYSGINLTVKSLVAIEDGYLFNNNVYIGNLTTMICKVIDNSTRLPVKNYNVTFYANSTYLGYNLTDLSGWANFSFLDFAGFETQYNVSCNISDNSKTYAYVTDENSSIDQLNVWDYYADVVKPKLKNYYGNPLLSNVGLGFNSRVYVSDDVKVKQTDFCVRVPGSYTYSCYKMAKPASINGTGNYTYTFTGDNLEGKYFYYYKAYDNWTISNWNVSPIFSFEREISDAIISIKNKNKIYKKIQDVEILDYSVNTILNTSFGEVSGYIGPYIVFNNSFADEFSSWSKINNPNNNALYSGDGGIFGGVNYEDLDVDTGGSATSRTPGTDNSASRFSMEGCTYSIGSNIYPYFEKNLSLKSYEDVNISFYYADNGVPTMVSGGYPLSLDVYDGLWYQANTIQGTGGSDTAITASDYGNVLVDLSGYNKINNFKIRFSGGGSGATTDHFALDDVLVIGSASDVISKQQDYTFGNNNLNLSHFSIIVTINDYDNRGSVGNIEPDLSLEFFDGSDFVSKKYCDLEDIYGFNNSVSSTQRNCTITISNLDVIKAWENKNFRKLRINAENIDVSSVGSDNINWSNVYFKYYTPSLVYNPGSTDFDIYLTNRIYRNNSNELKGLVNLTLIKILTKNFYDIENSWNSVYLPLVPLENGLYYSSSALTDGSGNIIKDSKGKNIVSTDSFEIRNLFVNITSPKPIKYPENSDVWVNVTLDNTYYSSNGWCAYQLNNGSNVSMTQIDATHFAKQIPYYNFTLYDNYVRVFCKDSFGDVSVSDTVQFNMTISLKIAFVSPTDLDGAVLNRTWTYVNVVINDTYATSAYLNFNDSLRGYWNFENASGHGFVKDFSNNSNNGYFKNGANVSISKKIRGEYGVFDGDADYIIIDDSDSEIFNGKDFSIGFWIKINDLFIKHNIFSKNNLFSLSYEPVGKKFISRVNNAVDYPSSNNAVIDGNWTYFNVLYKEGSYIKYYVNGNLFSQVNTTQNLILNSNNITLGVLSKSNLVDSLNGTIDELVIFDRIIYDKEIKSLYDAKVNYLQNNYTKLKNGNYTFEACGIDEWGNYGCTEVRDILVNITLPKLYVNLPINNSKFMYKENVLYNFTTDISVYSSWFVLNNNETKYFLDDASLGVLWLNNFSYKTGHYNFTAYANDSVDNVIKSKVYYFVVLPDYYIFEEKSISSSDFNKYFVENNIKNFGFWYNYSFLDFSDYSFSPNLFSLNPNFNYSISNYNFYGDVFVWNFNFTNSSYNFNYFLNGNLSNSYLSRNYVVGIE